MKKTIIIVLLLVLGCIIVGTIDFFLLSKKLDSSYNRLVCKSDRGNITVYFDDEKIVGNSSSGLSYNFDEKKDYISKVGIDAFLDEFENWFISNTSGVCTKQLKDNNK